MAEFVPFVFQILSQMLELRQGGDIPPSYTTLLPSLLTPALWQVRGNIPALVRLLQAFLAKGSAQLSDGNIQSLLGIYQQLIASRVNDEFGFELLLSIFQHIERCVREQTGSGIEDDLVTHQHLRSLYSHLPQYPTGAISGPRPDSDVDKVAKQSDREVFPRFRSLCRFHVLHRAAWLP